MQSAVRLTSLLLITFGAAAGCSAAAPAAPPSRSLTPSPSASAQLTPTAPQSSPSAETAEGVTSRLATAASVQSGDAAIALEAVLGEHALLAADMMRARIRGDADLAQAANSALAKNTIAINNVLTPVVPAEARARFASQWGEHIQALFNYARGLSIHNAEVRDDAGKELIEYEGELAEFFVSQSHGRLSRSAALAAVRMHVDHLIQGADAYAAKDYAGAAHIYRLTFAHTFSLGEILARAMMPAAAAKALDAPTMRLRSALTRLLGEHVGLVVAMMRSAVGDQKDYLAMGAAVDGNTLELTSAMESLFGSAAAQKFQTLWADHVDQLMVYTSATVKHDAPSQEHARTQLGAFEQSFADYLSAVTKARLGRPALAQAFVTHDRMLLAQIDAYAAKSFGQAHDLGDQTYADMFDVSAQLSTAIGATIAARLPRGGSQTGAGAMAGAVEGRK